MKFISPKFIRFHRCDSAGIDFYAQYYYLPHATQYDFFSHIGFSLQKMIIQGNSVPIVNMQTQISGLCRQADSFDIELSTSKIGGSIINIEYAIFGIDQQKNYRSQAQAKNNWHSCLN